MARHVTARTGGSPLGCPLGHIPRFVEPPCPDWQVGERASTRLDVEPQYRR